MSYEIVVQSEAIIEIQEAFEWYEHQSAGLGYDLIEELEDGYRRLSGHPTIIRLSIRNTGNSGLNASLI